MRVLVTGGTGLLGNNLIRAALARGFQVETVCRSGPNAPAFAGLDIVAHAADITDLSALTTVLRGGFDAVIHCAAHIHIGWKQRDTGLLINETGTQRLLEACKNYETRIIHVSTVNTLSVGTEECPSNEDTEGGGQIPCTYVVSKQAAERRAIEAVQRGQDVLMVHPGFMLGPWDWKPSSGRIVQGLCGFIPLAPPGGCTVCDPRDVSEAILNAINRGVSGRHYILGGENLTYLDLWRRIAKKLGKSGPWTYMRLPGRVIAGSFGDMLGWISGREPDVNSAAIAMATQFQWFSSQRAIDELDYCPRPVDESIHDAVTWLREHQYL